MSMCLYGVEPKNEEWLQMKNIYENCTATNVDVPQKVLDYFDFDKFSEEEITDEGLEICLASKYSISSDAIAHHKEYMQDGFVVDLEKLNKLNPGVKVLKFVNSY